MRLVTARHAKSCSKAQPEPALHNKLSARPVMVHDDSQKCIIVFLTALATEAALCALQSQLEGKN